MEEGARLIQLNLSGFYLDILPFFNLVRKRNHTTAFYLNQLTSGPKSSNRECSAYQITTNDIYCTLQMLPPTATPSQSC